MPAFIIKPALVTQTLGKKILMRLPFKQCRKVLLKQCALVFVCLRNLVWGAASNKPKCCQIWWCTSCRFLPVALRFKKMKVLVPYSGWVWAENNTLLHVCSESLSTKRCKGPAKVSLQFLSTADRINLELSSPCEVALDLGLLYEYPVSELCCRWGQLKPLTNSLLD